MNRNYYHNYSNYKSYNNNEQFNRKSYKKNNYKKDNYKKNLDFSINIPDKYLNLLNKNWPCPSALSNYILSKIPLESFYYTEKIDGIHTHLLIFNKKVYDVSKTPDLSLIKQIDNSEIKNMNFEGDCIIETEFYNNIYFIFDVYYLNGINYSDKYLFERINPIKQYINEFGPNFRIKNYYSIPDLNFLLEYIKKDKSPEGNEIDGVILQRIDMPYFQDNWKEFSAYKLKPMHLITIDFLLKYNYKYNLYYLYLRGNYNRDFYNNFKKLPKDNNIYDLNNINQIIRGNKFSLRDEKVLIYFDSPFYPNLGIMKINKNWNKNNYSEKSIKLIDELINKIEKNPWDYHNKIVELSLTEDKKWVPLRVREDKTIPNSYRVGLNNISIIFDQIKPPETLYFQKDISISLKEQNIIHKICQTFRKYIIEEYINKYYEKNASIIDLCGGRGADEFNLYSNGVSNFYVIDYDTTALKRYFDRTYSINKMKYEPLSHKFRDKLNWGRNYISLNFLNYKLDKDYQQIKNDLLSRYEFQQNKKVDIVLMNFAIHYLCDEKEKIEKLCEFVYSVLFDRGTFIITYFDGDEILKNKNNNFSKIGPFNIEILREKEENTITIAKMPLPTIKAGKNIYAEEPLVHKNMIKILDKYFDLYKEEYVYDNCKNYIDKIDFNQYKDNSEEFDSSSNKEENTYDKCKEKTNEVYDVQTYIEYYKLIKVGVYYKKNFK